MMRTRSDNNIKNKFYSISRKLKRLVTSYIKDELKSSTINYPQFVQYLDDSHETESHWLNFLEIFVEKKEIKKIDFDFETYYSALK